MGIARKDAGADTINEYLKYKNLIDDLSATIFFHLNE